MKPTGVCTHPMFPVMKGCPCDNVECEDCFYKGKFHIPIKPIYNISIMGLSIDY
jgi:hypothetical protein